MSDFDAVSRAGLLVDDALGPVTVERRDRVRAQPLLVSIAPGLHQERRGQLMLVTALNVLTRLFDFVGAIALDVPPGRSLRGIFGLPAGTQLGQAAARFARSLHREPGRAAIDVRDPGPRYARALVIGDHPVNAADVVYIDGSGWCAAVGADPVRLPEVGGATNPIGPLVAAALGAAEIARLIFRTIAPGSRLKPLEAPVHWDLWSHGAGPAGAGPALPAEVELGGVGIAGLGALGSAALLALSQLEGVGGELELVDDDLVSPTNLERLLLARGTDVGRRKVGLARRVLIGTRLRARPIDGRYGARLPHGVRAATVLVGVDSGAARRNIVHHLPEALYNGGTQASELLVSRHVRFEGACLECLYPVVEDPVARTARKLGVDRQTAEALVAGDRKLDAEVLAALARRGGASFVDVEPEELLGEPLAALEGYECSRAVVIEELPEATIGFVAALCGFLMAAELLKDKLAVARPTPLDPVRPVYRLDALHGRPGPECVEDFVPRRDCFCQDDEVQRRLHALRAGVA